MKRVIVYEMKDGSEDVFELATVEEEQAERTHAQMELSSSGSLIRGYRFEWREDEDAQD